MTRSKVVGVLGFALFLGGLGAAGGLVRAEDGPAAPGPTVRVDIGEESSLGAFLDALAKALGRPLVYDPQDKSISGRRIKGLTHLEGTTEDVLARARALLTFHDLVIVPVGPADRQIHLVMDARQTTSILKLKPVWVELDEQSVERLSGQDGLFVSGIVTVRHMRDLRDARNALQRVVTPQNIGNVQEVPAARAFVVTDFAPNVAAVWRLIRRMDTPHAALPPDEIRVIALRHRRAGDVVPLLHQVLPVAPAARPGVPTQGPPSPAVPPEERPRIAADEGTNSVLLSGSTPWLDQLADVIQRLDVPPVVLPPPR
jgi:type II secretory pathway component GspD/PulD (secretin)